MFIEVVLISFLFYIIIYFNFKRQKMRNKELISNKLEKLEGIIKLIGYHTFRDEREEAYQHIDKALEKIQEMQTLISTETQD